MIQRRSWEDLLMGLMWDMRQERQERSQGRLWVWDLGTSNKEFLHTDMGSYFKRIRFEGRRTSGVWFWTCKVVSSSLDLSGNEIFIIGYAGLELWGDTENKSINFRFVNLQIILKPWDKMRSSRAEGKTMN